MRGGGDDSVGVVWWWRWCGMMVVSVWYDGGVGVGWGSGANLSQYRRIAAAMPQ